MDNLEFAAVIGCGDVLAVASTERKAVSKAMRQFRDLVAPVPGVQRVDVRIDVYRCTPRAARFIRLLEKHGHEPDIAVRLFEAFGDVVEVLPSAGGVLDVVSVSAMDTVAPMRGTVH